MQFRDYIAQRETILADHFYGALERLALSHRDPEQACLEMKTDAERTRMRLEALRQEMHSRNTVDAGENP